MKKIIAVVMCVVLAAMMCVGACAETIHRQHGVDMESALENCTLRIGFSLDDVNDECVFADVYDEVTYDIVDVNRMKVGDVIETAEGDVTVESISQDDDGININGGMEEGGVTLGTEEDTNGFYERDFEYPAMVMIGQAQLFFDDTVKINVYKMNDDLSIAGEGYDTVEVAGNEAAAELAKIGEKFYGEFSPYQTTATIGEKEGVIVEITIDYMP